MRGNRSHDLLCLIRNPLAYTLFPLIRTRLRTHYISNPNPNEGCYDAFSAFTPETPRGGPPSVPTRD